MLRIERVDAASWPRWREVRLRSLLDAPDSFGSTAERERAFTEDEWRARLTGPTWIAEVDEPQGSKDVGTVACGDHAPSGLPWVYAMWVDPAWRGTDVAVALLDTVAEHVRAAGATQLGLDVTDRAPRAQRFYERYGFVENGVTRPLPRDPAIVLIEMVYDLTTDRDRRPS